MPAKRKESTKPKCDAPKSGGGTCKRPSGWGTDHQGYGPCKFHGGMTPGVRKKYSKVMADQRAHDVMQSIDLTLFDVDVDPAGTMLRELNRCQRVVDYCAHQLENLTFDEIAGLMITKVTDANGIERTVTENVWMRLYGEWSDRLVKIAKGVQELGLLERHVRVQEDQLMLIIRAMELALRDHGIKYTKELSMSIQEHIGELEQETT